MIAWEKLTSLEPRLADLLQQAQAVKPKKGGYFCANDVWYGRTSYPNFREEVYRMAGWEAENRDPMLITRDAFDVVYKKIYSALPPCRGCICL